MRPKYLPWEGLSFEVPSLRGCSCASVLFDQYVVSRAPRNLFHDGGKENVRVQLGFFLDDKFSTQALAPCSGLPPVAKFFPTWFNAAETPSDGQSTSDLWTFICILFHSPAIQAQSRRHQMRAFDVSHERGPWSDAPFPWLRKLRGRPCFEEEHDLRVAVSHGLIPCRAAAAATRSIGIGWWQGQQPCAPKPMARSHAQGILSRKARAATTFTQPHPLSTHRPIL